jgi:hypothetical protein
MAQLPDFKKLTIASIKENIKAVDYCINYDKSINEDWAEDEVGCLGIPTIILLCSIIDTMGSYFRDTATTIQVNNGQKSINTASDHFLILNHDKLFNLKLDSKTIYDFYSKYRSILTHNNTLPPNTSLDVGKEKDEAFTINSEGEVIQVKLIPLYDKIKTASKTFIHYVNIGNWSDDHKLSNEIESKKNFSGISDASPTITASTITTSSKN